MLPKFRDSTTNILSVTPGLKSVDKWYIQNKNVDPMLLKMFGHFVSITQQHKTFTQCCINVGPSSSTQAQHRASLGGCLGACWEWALCVCVKRWVVLCYLSRQRKGTYSEFIFNTKLFEKAVYYYYHYWCPYIAQLIFISMRFTLITLKGCEW